MQIGFLGFGEAASTFVQTLRTELDLSVVTFDRLLDDAATRQIVIRRADALSVICADSAIALANATHHIFSTVTADQSLLAVQALCEHLTPDHVIFDMNSVSPGKKRATAELVCAQGAQYIDIAVMAPVLPRGHQTPMLVSGPNQAVIEPLLRQMRWNVSWKGDAIGDASVVKMLRSILIKGMESLISECVTAAEPLGIAEQILASAGKTLGISEMASLSDYVMERVAVHGQRRSEEMREVAATLTELGVSNHMAHAIADHQQMIATLDARTYFKGSVPKDRSQLGQFFNRGQQVPGDDT